MRRDDPQLHSVPGSEPLPFSEATIVAALSPLVLPRRLERMQTVIASRTTRVLPILDGLVDPHNASAVMRSCDAFGLQRVMVIEADQRLRASRTVTKGADRWLTVEKFSDAKESFLAAKEQGYAIWVATMGGNRRAEEAAQVDKVALVFGNEHRGPSDVALAHADASYAIPMRGFVESLNVSVAAAISLQLARGNRPGDLSAADQQALLARYLMRSVRKPEEAIARYLEAEAQPAKADSL